MSELSREHEIIEYSSDFEDNEIETINDIKTYKTDECVICMENKSYVLYCDCGHICICEECIKIKRFNRCPICKTLNNTLRII